MQTSQRPENLPTAPRPNVRRLQRPLRTRYLADPIGAGHRPRLRRARWTTAIHSDALVRPKGLDDAIRVAVHVKHGGRKTGRRPAICCALACRSVTS